MNDTELLEQSAQRLAQKEQAKKEQSELQMELLSKIAENLGSIRSMLTFFTVLAVLSLLFAGCNVLMLF